LLGRESGASLRKTKNNGDFQGVSPWMPFSSFSGKGKGQSKGKGNGKWDGSPGSSGQWDDHSHWGECENTELMRDTWTKRAQDAAQAMEIRDPSNSRGTLPLFAQRLLGEMNKAQTDWRTILNEFVQEDIVDYSFFPPDRRFDDGDFFLPDFNEKDDSVENILFMIDTSGSMSDKMITAAYSEIQGAIDQFDGKLKGWLGFFDAAVVEPKPFTTEDDFKIIRPVGGGGTDFGVIFDYVRKEMVTPPASIIILTDGYAPFPQKRAAMGIPTLWLINNDDVTPPWGKIARIKV
jgi:predicted metal-dependent peptidase